MDRQRRSLLKGTSAVIFAALAAGLQKAVQAADWNKAAFEARDLASAQGVIGAAAAAKSNDILLKAPDIAENGALVPVSVVSSIPNTTSVAILVEKNPSPLAAQFDFANGAMADVSVRLKFNQTSIVRVIVKADGKFYTVQREVKVTTGDCAG